MFKGKKGKTWNNVWTYIGIVFLFGMFVYMIQASGESLRTNPNANLDNASKEYILELHGFDLDSANIIDTSSTDQEEPIEYDLNDSTSTPKDFAIEFFWNREKSVGVTNTAKNIFNIPSNILLILRLDVGDWKWAVNSMIWLFIVGILIAGVYFMTGRNDK